MELARPTVPCDGLAGARGSFGALGIKMGNEALRKELQEIASDKDIATHGARIAALSSRFDCSIRVLSDYDPTSRENFNCFEYALGLNEQLRNATLVVLSEVGVLVDHGFISYLQGLGVLKERSLDDLRDGDLVIYFENTLAQHAGRWSRGRVISKWAGGLLYDHKPLETPLHYGTPYYFEAIPGPKAKDYFLRYAREERDIADEYLDDP